MSCIACKNKYSKSKCNRLTKNNTQFCGYHQNSTNLFNDDNLIDKVLENKKTIIILTFDQLKSGNQIIKYIKKNYYNILNNNYSDYLINGESSWSEIPIKYRYKLTKNELWDIRFLIKHFSSQLNCSNNSEPSPQYPFNPFNRNKYNVSTLKSFHKYINKYNITIPDQLYEFLSHKFHILNSIRNNSSYKIVPKLTKKMRYKMINSCDSQNNYIGTWVYKNVELSTFEQIYREWINIPPYTYDNIGRLIPNPYRRFYKEILDSCMVE
jgi:hypothetical protein